MKLLDQYMSYVPYAFAALVVAYLFHRLIQCCQGKPRAKETIRLSAYEYTEMTEKELLSPEKNKIVIKNNRDNNALISQINSDEDREFLNSIDKICFLDLGCSSSEVKKVEAEELLSLCGNLRSLNYLHFGEIKNGITIDKISELKEIKIKGINPRFLKLGDLKLGDLVIKNIFSGSLYIKDKVYQRFCLKRLTIRNFSSHEGGSISSHLLKKIEINEIRSKSEWTIYQCPNLEILILGDRKAELFHAQINIKGIFNKLILLHIRSYQEPHYMSYGNIMSRSCFLFKDGSLNPLNFPVLRQFIDESESEGFVDPEAIQLKWRLEASWKKILTLMGAFHSDNNQDIKPNSLRVFPKDIILVIIYVLHQLGVGKTDDIKAKSIVSLFSRMLPRLGLGK